MYDRRARGGPIYERGNCGMNPEYLLPEGFSLAHDAHQTQLETFRDSLGQPVRQWPKALLPSTTVIVVEDLSAFPWIVLVHQRADNQHWGFLGGAQEAGESIAACAIRECEEESGYRIQLHQLTSIDSDPIKGAIAQYEDGAIHYTNITFLATVLSGTRKVSNESLDVRWHSIHNLPYPFLDVHKWRLHQALQVYFEPNFHVPVR